MRVSFLTKPPPPPATNAAFVAASRASIHRGAAGAASQQQQAPSSLTTTPVNVSAFGGKARSNGGAGSASGSDSAETKSEVGNSEYGGGRSCAACTYVNLGTSPDCAMCGTELPPTAAGASASAASGPRGRNDGSSSLSTPSPGAHGNGSRPTVRAALTNDSSLAIRNRRTNAMAGRGHKITEVGSLDNHEAPCHLLSLSSYSMFRRSSNSPLPFFITPSPQSSHVYFRWRCTAPASPWAKSASSCNSPASPNPRALT